LIDIVAAHDVVRRRRYIRRAEPVKATAYLWSIPMNLHVTPRVRVRQIDEADLDGVVDLLARGFPARRRSFWSGVIALLAAHRTPTGLPKYGYLLENDGTPVGVILAIFTIIHDGAAPALRCSVSSWYVEPAFRTHANLLVSRLFRHKDATYLNVTASPHTFPIVRAQGYTQYSQGIFIAVPALQRGSMHAHVTPFGAEQEPPAHCEPFERDLLRHHADYGCISLWCVAGARAHPFLFRRRTVKGLPLFAQLIYCPDLDDLVRFAGPIGRLLARRGMPFMVVDANGPIAGLTGKYFDARFPKFFKGPHRPRLGDLAYTETAMFGF
jgi:hypothetical protein